VLIHHWERLRRWLDEDREFLRWRQRLQAAVVEWERIEHDRGVLLRGSPLTEAKRWLTERANELTSAERDFIEESVALQLREARTLRLHRAVAVVAVFALMMGVGVFAWLQVIGQRPKPLGEPNNLTERLSSIREAGDQAGEGRILTGIGAIYYSLGNYEKALEFFKQALAIQREIGDRAGEGSTLSNLGAIHYSLGKSEMASVLYGRALAIQEAIGDQAGEGRILTGIGAVYTKRDDYEKALEFFKRALAIKEKEAIGDQAGEGRILTGIGAIYYSLGNYEKGNYEKALEFFKRALAIQREIGDRAGEGSTLSNLGAVYDNLGDNTRALTYHQQALEIQRAIGDQAKGQP
jgi:tetratricopeptide (TPR) repeat protein